MIADPLAPPQDGIWTMSHLVELINAGHMKAVTFLPDETIPISWNNVTVYVTKGREIEVPEVHYRVYMDSRKATAEAFENARTVLEKRTFGPGQTSVEAGWNGNSPQ